LHKQRIQVVTG